MPFPLVTVPPPHQAEYAKIAHENLAIELAGRVSNLAVAYNVPDASPTKAAAVVYLGLCRLRRYTEAKDWEGGRAACANLLKTYQPDTGDISVNASFFIKDPDDNRFSDHGAAVKRACNVYMPLVKARRKRCLVLLALGSAHVDGEPLPPDDSWVASFRF